MEILSLGEKLKRRRKEVNMTLKDLAGDRITAGQISLVESGKSKPSMDLLQYLADTLNVSMEYLMEAEESQAEKICMHFENLAEAHILNEDYLSAEKYIEEVVLYAEKYNLHYRKARNLFLRGVICEKREEIQKAQSFFIGANAIFIKLNSYEDIINTFLELGTITLKMKSYHSACSYFKQAEKIYLDYDIGNDFLLGEIYCNISNIYVRLENNEGAIEYAMLAKQKLEQLDNKKEYVESLLASSKDYGLKGDIKKAIKYSQKALKLLKDLSDLDYKGKVENSLGRLFYEFGDYEESFAHLKNSKKIREARKDTKLVETLINICENYIKLKDIDSCKKILEEIVTAMESGDEKNLIDYYIIKYRVFALEGDLHQVEQTLIMALEFSRTMDYKKEQAEISLMLGKFYNECGQDNKAYKFLANGVEVFKTLGAFEGII